jgi:hypothetical protein
MEEQQAAKKGQNTDSTEYLNMESGIVDCMIWGRGICRQDV